MTDNDNLIKLNTRPIAIVEDVDTGYLYAIAPNRMARRIYVDIPFSDFYGNLTVNIEKNRELREMEHERMHELGIYHDHGHSHDHCEEPCDGCCE